MSEPATESAQPDDAGVELDVESDPALDDETGSEWADEGGAVDDGPATDPEAS